MLALWSSCCCCGVPVGLIGFWPVWGCWTGWSCCGAGCDGNDEDDVISACDLRCSLMTESISNPPIIESRCSSKPSIAVSASGREGAADAADGGRLVGVVDMESACCAEPDGADADADDDTICDEEEGIIVCPCRNGTDGLVDGKRDGGRNADAGLGRDVTLCTVAARFAFG